MENDIKSTYTKFGEDVFNVLSQRGWNAIPKRELTITLLHLAQTAGLLDLTKSRYTLAAKLKVSPSVLDGLLRDMFLFFGDVKDLSYQNFAEWIRQNNYTSEDEARKQKVVVALRSQEERMTVEKFLDDHNYVPDFKNNNRLLVFDLPRLLTALSQTVNAEPSQLISELGIEYIDVAHAGNSEKKLVDLAISALREQFDKNFGEATTELVLTLFKSVKNKMTRQ